MGKLSLDPHLIEQDHISELQSVIDEVNDRLFFYLNQSNLARIVASSNLDLVGGTAALWVESIDDVTPFYFRSIPAIALIIEHSTDDVLNTCWYQCRMRWQRDSRGLSKIQKQTKSYSISRMSYLLLFMGKSN